MVQYWGPGAKIWGPVMGALLGARGQNVGPFHALLGAGGQNVGSFHWDIIRGQEAKRRVLFGGTCGVLSWGHYWGPGAKIWGPFMEHLWGLFMGHLWGPGAEMWGHFIGHLWGPVT